MILKKILIFLPIASTVLFAEPTGDKLFEANCAKCHATILGVSNDDGYENDYITSAPYITDLVKKLKEETKSQDEFKKFVKEYIQNPDKRKSLYGKKGIKKFGLMPSLKGAMSDSEIEILTDYLYNEKFNHKEPKKIKEKRKVVVDPREKLFTDNCAKCHSTILGVVNSGGYNNSYITPAPYVTNLVKKLKKETKSQDEFRAFIKEYIQNPDKRKSLYGKKAIKKFGLMPSLKGTLSDKEINQLANYLYEKYEN